MNFRFVEFCIPQGPFNWVHGTPEQVSVQLFKTSAGDGGVEVDTLILNNPNLTFVYWAGSESRFVRAELQKMRVPKIRLPHIIQKKIRVGVSK